jgi:membrane-bound lytic murein transglycosylase F
MQEFVKTYLLLGLAFSLMTACNFDKKKESKLIEHPKKEIIVRDLDAIRQRGKLVVLTENSSSSYYLYRGQPMGYDYEMLNDFAKSEGLALEIIVMEDLNDMFDHLHSGKGDLIACNLTVTSERKDKVEFTKPLLTTRQVLVQRKPNKWYDLKASQLEDSLIRDLKELADLDIYVHEYSSFYSRLQSVQDEIGKDINIISASGNIDSEQLIRLVAEGQIPYTVADENVALLNQTYYPQLDVKMPISFEQDIAWALRPNSSELLAALNDWIGSAVGQRKLTFAHKKYFESSKDQKDRTQSEYSSLNGNGISLFDDAIKKESQRLEWDWRLLASMIYHESRFNPNARSWAGAFGLMQLMPNTAERFGIDSTASSSANIKAGVSYLKYLEKFWEKRVPDRNERLKFILASYNVGPGHVLDAQKIATYLNKNPQIWENNVADCLLLKSQSEYFTLDVVKHGYCRGEEAYKYVKRIMNTYQHYQTMES